METKDQIAAERDTLREENTRLRAQLAAAGRGGYQPSQRFLLSEGARQELEMYGVTNIGGRRLTTDEVRDRLGEDQYGVEIGEALPGLDRSQDVVGQRAVSAIPGVDFVYPSVAPGQIDPAVAGTPGINGPAADDVPDLPNTRDYDPAVDGE